MAQNCLVCAPRFLEVLASHISILVLKESPPVQKWMTFLIFLKQSLAPSPLVLVIIVASFWQLKKCGGGPFFGRSHGRVSSYHIFNACERFTVRITYST